ncbi:hypothetical protein K458DRAFT_384557 [Lentithecium fluviatile CBS 122367]|uniref:Uncharacterized protein n=1 Tax=Lentithecium fluviatile CBS 122367 TaxID=1168545 RepID=A0A6G1JE06_9PLEO|nr:hypothetical protein K458DRAFT_384557 [Lentithecium fluviatile CBS 122367]
MAKPTIVVVPSAVPAHASFDENVKVIRERVMQLVEMGEKEIILVTHSYTGVPGTERRLGWVGTITVSPEDAKRLFYQDLPSAEANK